MYESKLLNIVSPMFHHGILFVLVGHLMGLFVPESWTDAVGLKEHGYHLLPLFGGTAAGVLAAAGILTPLYRRRAKAPEFRVTTANDKVMCAVLLAAIVMGVWAELTNSSVSSGCNCRESIAPGRAACSRRGPTWR